MGQHVGYKSERYLIAGSVIFVPGNGLYLPGSGKIECKLSMVSDGILLLLIASQGRVISKQDIQRYFWREFLIDVSTASVNNNLSSLRYHLKMMGVGDLIVTSPRVGISIRVEDNIVRIDEVATSEYEVAYHNDTLIQDLRTSGKSKRVAALVLIILILTAFFLISHNNEERVSYIGRVNEYAVFLANKISRFDSVKLM